METEFKGTPGPWFIDKSKIDWSIISQYDLVVDRIGHEDMAEDEIIANAKLIAAAPTMFEALQIIANEDPRTFCRLYKRATH